MSFKELQVMAKANAKPLNAFFKSNGRVILDQRVLMGYKELATRIVSVSRGASLTQASTTAIRIQTQRINMINKALKVK